MEIYQELLGMEFSKDLNAASATPLILMMLEREPRYGYALIREVEALSKGRLQWEEGMLYPILHRLEKLGWIHSEWIAPPSGRRRKYYSLLPEGKRSLNILREQWNTMHEILETVASHSVAAVSWPESNDEDVLPVSLL